MTKQQTNEQLRVGKGECSVAVYVQERATELAEQSMKALGTHGGMCVRNSQLTRLQLSSVFYLLVFHPQDQFAGTDSIRG